MNNNSEKKTSRRKLWIMSNIITVREDLIENINEIEPFDLLTSTGIIYRHIAPDGRSYIGILLQMGDHILEERQEGIMIE